MAEERERENSRLRGERERQLLEERERSEESLKAEMEKRQKLEGELVRANDKLDKKEKMPEENDCQQNLLLSYSLKDICHCVTEHFQISLHFFLSFLFHFFSFLKMFIPAQHKRKFLYIARKTP